MKEEYPPLTLADLLVEHKKNQATKFRGISIGPYHFDGIEYELPLQYEMASALSRRRGLSNNANKMAIRLANRIEVWRSRYSPAREVLVKAGRWRLPPFTLFEAGEEVHLDKEWRRRAAGLNELSAKTWRSWADLAWEMVLAGSPKRRPELNPGFYANKTKICNVRKERTDSYYEGVVVTGPSIARSDIKEALFNAFEAVVTGKSSRTRQRQKSSPT